MWIVIKALSTQESMTRENSASLVVLVGFLSLGELLHEHNYRLVDPIRYSCYAIS